MKLIETFEAVGEDGLRYIVEAYGGVAHRPLAGAARALVGSLDYRLADGRELSAVKGDPTAFRILDTDEIIHRL